MNQELVHYGDIPPAVGVMAVMRLLDVAQPVMLMQRWPQVTQMPRKRGDTVRWTRYERFAAALAKIAEGVTPTADHLEKFVVLLEPIDNDQVGVAVVNGFAVVRVAGDVGDYVDVIPGQCGHMHHRRAQSARATARRRNAHGRSMVDAERDRATAA
jgi:hypothetical protein